MYLLENEKKYTLEELYKGMVVRAKQLSEIWDTYIILTDVHLVRDDMGICTSEGTIDAISKEFLPLKKPHSTLIFHDSLEREEWYDNE